MKSATRIYVSVMGCVTGLVGIEHGLGEISQGHVTAPGLFFQSWPNSSFFQIMSGEPAFSIITHIFSTGILACAFSAAYSILSLRFPDRRNSSFIMVFFSILMFLFGGGIFPPVFAFMIGLSAARLKNPATQSRVFSNRWDKFFSILWPAVFWICLAFWFAMIPVIPAFDYFFGFSSEVVFIAVLLGMIFSFVLADLSAKARDKMKAGNFQPYPAHLEH